MHLPLDVDPADYVGRLDGLLLSGGEDVEPRAVRRRGRERPLPTGSARDRVELGFVDMAMADEMPVLGICRGPAAAQRVGRRHPAPARARARPLRRAAGRPHRRVVVDAGTLLHELYGADHTSSTRCTTRPCGRVADGWLVAARSGDGTVEGIEWPGHDVLAVQWHPELLPTRPTDPIFAWLVERAESRPASRALNSCAGRCRPATAPSWCRPSATCRPASSRSGVDADVDFRSMAVVANVFRVASGARHHLERTVLAA